MVTKQIRISKETDDLVSQAIEIFKTNHPDFIKFNKKITYNDVINKALEFYIEA
jgi:hypothetical protein